MNKSIVLSFLVLSVSLFAFSGCGKGDNGNHQDENETNLIERVEKTTSTAGDYFDKCSTAEELRQYISDIKQIQGVNDAYINGNALFVDIQGWGKVAYLYPLKRDDSFSDLVKGVEFGNSDKTSRTKGNTPENERYSICYASQMNHDETFQQPISVTSSNLNDYLSDKGFNFTAELFTIEWIYTKMLYYDSVIIDTHGNYDNGVHWLLTANEIGKEEWAENYSKLAESFSALGDSESMAMSSKELRNGVYQRVWYIAVSEEAIKNIPGYGFETERPHIVFNAACQSLTGTQRLADAFIKQGATCYLGFDEINCVGHKSAMSMFFYLAKGYSIEEAYELMQYKIDSKTNAKLLCIEDNTKNLASTYILPPFIPEELNSALGQYLPINRGYNPPNIEGDYIVNPVVYLYDSSYSYYAGQRDSNPAYFRFSNQNSISQTISFEEIASGGIEYDYGSGHIYGDENRFTIISDGITEVTGFKLDSSLNIEYYKTYGDAIWIISGTKIGDAIENWQHGWLFKSIIQDRPEGGIIRLPDVGTVMVFKDGDGVSGYYPFPQQ